MRNTSQTKTPSYDWLRELNLIGSLSKGAVKVAIAIWSRNFGKMEAFPSYSTIARDCGWSSSGRVRGYIKELVNANLLTIEKKWKGGRHHNHYVLHIPQHAVVDQHDTDVWGMPTQMGASTQHGGVCGIDKNNRYMNRENE